MNQIVPHFVWVGHADSARDIQTLFRLDIRAVVQLAVEETPLSLPREIMYCRFPLVDGTGNAEKTLVAAVKTLVTLLELRVPTLVACGAGMSRSPAVTAAALSVVLKETPDECLRQVCERHPADVSPALWDEVKRVALPA